MTFRSIVLALIIATSASPATALSCLRPDIASSFDRAAQAEESYVILHGQFDFDGGAMAGATMTDNNRTDDPASLPAIFTGQMLTPDGFSDVPDQMVTLQSTCAGPWCGGMGPGVKLAFVQQIGSDLILYLGACGGNAFDDPTPADLDLVTSCLRGVGCASPQP